MDSVKTFSINDISEVSTEESDEFFYARMCVLSTRPNSHKLLITKDILTRDGESIRGKWIVADTSLGEDMTHTEDEVIVGIVPMDANIEYIDDEYGYTSMYVDCVLSKLYAKNLYDLFKKDDERNVSVEMLTEDEDEDFEGNTPISGLRICGVTILGKWINGSCPNANIKVVQFSADNANKFYDNCNKTSLRKFAEERKEKLNIKSNKKDFNINSNNDNKEDKMEDKKEFKSKVDDKEKDIVMEEKDEKEDKSTEQPQEEEAKKEMADEAKEDKAETEEKEMGCGKEMSDDEEDKDKEDKEEKKEFSLKDFVDEESLEDKEMAEKLYSMSANDIVKEMARLKAFEDDRLAKDKEIKLSQIMASVKEDLETKTFSELQEEGSKLSLDELGGFENKVKAFAYEQSKGKEHKEDDGIMRFASNETTINEPKKLSLWD